MARRGRGRLSSLETLPEHAEAEVAWALEALAERKLTQVEILIQLNARLAALTPPAGPVVVVDVVDTRRGAGPRERIVMGRRGKAITARTYQAIEASSARFVEEVDD